MNISIRLVLLAFCFCFCACVTKSSNIFAVQNGGRIVLKKFRLNEGFELIEFGSNNRKNMRVVVNFSNGDEIVTFFNSKGQSVGGSIFGRTSITSFDGKVPSQGFQLLAFWGSDGDVRIWENSSGEVVLKEIVSPSGIHEYYGRGGVSLIELNLPR